MLLQLLIKKYGSAAMLVAQQPANQTWLAFDSRTNKQLRRDWTVGELTVLAELHSQGATEKQICQQLNRSRSSVRRMKEHMFAENGKFHSVAAKFWKSEDARQFDHLRPNKKQTTKI